MKNRKFWNWINQTDAESEQPERVLELYGSISSEAWFDDDITPKMFHDELFAGSGPVTIWLSSPGGDCIAASQIYSMLMDYKGDVTVKIDGLAASAASVIAMAGTKVLMAPTALMIIHNPMTSVCGNRDDLQKAIEMLDEVKESIINAYEIKTGLSRAKLSHLMDAEFPMHVGTAIELGFVDDVLKDEKRTALADTALDLIENAKMGSLKNELETADKADEPTEEPEQEEPEKETPAEPETEPQPEETGTPINELEKRLELLK